MQYNLCLKSHHNFSRKSRSFYKQIHLCMILLDMLLCSSLIQDFVWLGLKTNFMDMKYSSHYYLINSFHKNCHTFGKQN